MSTISNWRSGDDGRAWLYTLYEPSNVAADLDGKTVELWLTDPVGVTTKHACTKTGTAGQVSYTPAAADTATSGKYLLQFKTTDGTGKIASYPNSNDFVVIEVHPDA